ncbi:MAG: VCBS repeat-containing protein [Sphingobacteriales bacterium]|nr:MAG: VCBS repeat-containing protein [Sphingobacteriales bacterium]
MGKIPMNINARTVKIADIDGDDKPEIIVNGYNGAAMLQNTSTSTTVSFHYPPLDLRYMDDIEFADMNGDSKIDFVSTKGYPSAVTIYP